MLPKVESALRALEGGAAKAHIIDGAGAARDPARGLHPRGRRHRNRLSRGRVRWTPKTAARVVGEVPHASTTAASPIALVRGEGARACGTRDGKEYLDFTAGIAVTALGHCSPAGGRRHPGAAATLLHVSNLFHIAPADPPGQAALRALVRRPRVLLQLRRGGQRGGHQARPQVRQGARSQRPLRDHHHAQVVPRAHAGHRDRHRPGEVPARLRAAAVPASSTCPTTTSAPWSARWTAGPRRSSSSPSRARAASIVPDDGYLPGLRKLCDEAGVAAHPRRDPDRHGPHRAALGLRALRASSPTS